MSEARELVDELKDRFLAWRLRTRTREDSPDLEADLDEPDIEFTPLAPFASGLPAAPRAFADLTSAWIARQCAPEVFDLGRQAFAGRQVTRVHVLNARMTGTTQGRHFDDQEILFREGMLVATCTCKDRASSSVPSSAISQSAPATPPSEPADGSDLAARTLSCSHVVAILLAYLHKTTPAAATPSSPPPLPAPGKLVCPVTRQTLQPDRPLLQCQRCGICYSEAGWHFLRKEARGHCCGCDGRNTVK